MVDIVICKACLRIRNRIMKGLKLPADHPLRWKLGTYPAMRETYGA